MRTAACETVLVTGGTGRIGAPLVRALLARGDTVAVLTRDPGRATTIPGARLVKGTLFDPAALADALTGVTVVYHLAGGVRGAGIDTADRLNREGTEALLAGVRAAQLAPKAPPLRAFVYASSCAVYGDRSGLWVAEDYPPSPHTTYGAAKVAAEAAVTAAGIPARIARIAAVYGPGFNFLLADKMRENKAWLPGEGRNIVPVVHVDDCVAALLRIGDSDASGVFHVAGRTAPTLREFYTSVHAASGGAPVRFWSTWIPSALQLAVARANERIVAGLGRRPRFTEDNLRLYTASVRLRTERLEKELGFRWAFGDHKDGVRAAVEQAGDRAA
ncbi:MAG: NAD(P)-dependent oxidoreductase [Pseudomonadota bacterium]|nr:NAD(P)-dependent oxidoreductase [Pseudomonadota bacterium]